MTIQKTDLGRRRVPRRDYESSIGVLCAGKYELERSFQVGEGGILVSSKRPLTEGCRLVVSFFMTNIPIVVQAVVRNTVPASNGKPERYGLEFINLEFGYKREIRNYVASATRLSSSSALAEPGTGSAEQKTLTKPEQKRL